ncbi:putative aldehyde dehydrogenase-like protein [Sesbania bispinosa]|nr:putative aldehyde dehydrogenase-like protein [Sesbania bispinosa]
MRLSLSNQENPILLPPHSDPNWWEVKKNPETERDGFSSRSLAACSMDPLQRHLRLKKMVMGL